MTPERLTLLRELVEAENDATLLELRERFGQATGVWVSRETLAKALREMDITRKKKTFHATERDQDPEVIAEREAFIKAMPDRDPTHLLVLDECGINLGMTRAYARAKRGSRAKAQRPADKGGNVTLIAALTPQGIVAPVMLPGSLDGAAFKAYIEQALLPGLKPGDTLLLDNLSAHKVQGVAELLADQHAHLDFLPRYSPELSPIELAWSKVKAELRKAAARTYDALLEAVRLALNKISASDAQAYYEHSGYVFNPY